jgi:hypothetical protein
MSRLHIAPDVPHLALIFHVSLSQSRWKPHGKFMTVFTAHGNNLRARAMLSSVIRVNVGSLSGPLFPILPLGNLSLERRNRKLWSWLKIRHRYHWHDTSLQFSVSPQTPPFDSPHDTPDIRILEPLAPARDHITCNYSHSPKVLLDTSQPAFRANSKRQSEMRMEMRIDLGFFVHKH